jgi:hypothetical protein
MLDLKRYVDIMKPIVLMAAHAMMRARTVHANVSKVKDPKKANNAPKKIKLGIEISSGARAIPRAYEAG